MSGKGLVVNRTHGNGIGATDASLSQSVASEFDRSMMKATYIDDTPVPVVVMDCDHTIEYINGAAAMLAGTTPEASIGLKLWDLYDNDACRNGTCFTSRVLKEGRAMGGDAVCTVKGRKMPIRTYASPRFDEHNKIIGIVQVIQDNSEELRFSDELLRLVKASLDGQLGERGNSEKLQGRYRDLMCEINTMLDAVIGPLNVAAGYVARISKGDIPPKITDEYCGDFNEIKNNLNACIEGLGGLSEANAVLQRMALNDHTTKVTGSYQGVFLEVGNATNVVLDRLRHVVDTCQHISAGNFRADLDAARKSGKRSENDTLSPALREMMEGIDALTVTANDLSVAAVEGKLGTRADASKHKGDFRKIVEGVNSTLDAVVGPLNVTAGYVARISNGDIPPKITDEYCGDFNEIKNNLNQCIDALNGLNQQMVHMSTQHDLGEIDVVMPAESFRGAYRGMAEGVNKMVMGHISVKKKAMACIAEFGKGNLEAELEKFPGKKAFINENIERLRTNLKVFIKDMTAMADAHIAGDIDVVIPEEKFEGSYRTMAKGVNDMVMGHISVKKKAMACIKEFGEGNFEAELEKFPGKKAFINETIEQVRKNLKALIADADLLVQAALQGKLSTRADASLHHGDFRKIVEGVNSTLDAVVGPMQDVSAILTKLAGGDFTATVTNKYAGDYDLLTDAVNLLAKTVRSALEQIGRNVSSLASSAEELNKVSQSMGSNADETATQANVVSAAAEQVSNNVQTVATGADEMSASIKEIAKNTAEATRVASTAVRTAEATNITISKLGQSSAEIGQVIKVITSIAQQTNLLALNATIEAARAGEAGKGFAVVANEVKELAKETAKATEDISRKIEAIQGDTNGAVSAISQISQVIGQISDIQTTIASAIEEQSATTNEIGRTLAEAAKGSTDISKNIGGVAEAARATTVGATDTSKSAHSLEKMAAELQTLVSQFRY
jgi:methyl-accepting chemotaxis protein